MSLLKGHHHAGRPRWISHCLFCLFENSLNTLLLRQPLKYNLCSSSFFASYYEKPPTHPPLREYASLHMVRQGWNTLQKNELQAQLGHFLGDDILGYVRRLSEVILTSLQHPGVGTVVDTFQHFSEVE